MADEMTDQQARAVLEQIRDRNTAINQISDVLKRHDEALAGLEALSTQFKDKESLIASLDRAIDSKRGEIDGIREEIKKSAGFLKAKREEALAKVKGDADKLEAQLRADALKKIETGLAGAREEANLFAKEAQDHAEQVKAQLDAEIAEKQNKLDTLTAKIRQQIENLQHSI